MRFDNKRILINAANDDGAATFEMSPRRRPERRKTKFRRELKNTVKTDYSQIKASRAVRARCRKVKIEFHYKETKPSRRISTGTARKCSGKIFALAGKNPVRCKLKIRRSSDYLSRETRFGSPKEFRQYRKRGEKPPCEIVSVAL